MNLPAHVESFPILSPEDYLIQEQAEPVKHEFVDGVVYAMAGAGERHNRVAGNAFFHFRSATRGKTCGAYMADMKLRILADNLFYYPDVMLACDPDDDHPLYKTRPCVIVEVLSPSTAATDRREKWHAYRQLQSLKGYLMADAEVRRAEFYLRDGEGQWQYGRMDEATVFQVACGPVTVALSLDDLYEDVAVPRV